MAAGREDIAGWFDRGVADGATHLIVVCDTFDWEDYPVYVMRDENARDKYFEYHGKNMQEVMEVYDLRNPRDPQLNEYRTMNL